MPNPQIFKMPFAKLYPLYVQKAQRKGRTQEQVDQLITWLTGYTKQQVQEHIEQGCVLESFFAQAAEFNPRAALIKGLVCGVRVEAIDDPLMQKIRYLDKLIDELARGKSLDKIMR